MMPTSKRTKRVMRIDPTGQIRIGVCHPDFTDRHHAIRWKNFPISALGDMGWRSHPCRWKFARFT